MNLFKKAIRKLLREAIILQASGLGPQSLARIIEDLNDKAITVTSVPGGAIRFYTPSQLLIGRAETLVSKEKDTIEWIETFEENSVFWDVGANVGTYSLYAATSRRVLTFAFEPLAANYHVLNRNIQLNQLCDSVQAYCVAFAKDTQLGVLSCPVPTMGAAINQFGISGEVSRYWEGNASCLEQGMIGISIDDFVERFHPSFPDFIKMDVDGLEVEILHGAKKTLKDHRLKSLLVELNLTDRDEYDCALLLLREAGLTLVSSGEKQGTQSQVASNHIFKRIGSSF
jgi:FkbM family methyltransferase